MPIVKYQRQQTISDTNPVALATNKNLGNPSIVSETIAQSVESLAQRYQEIKKQNDEITLLNKSNQYDTKLTDDLINIQQNETGEKSFESLKNFKDRNTGYQSEILKDVSDPVQKAKLSNIFSNRTNDANLRIATHVAQQKKVALDYGLQTTLDNTIKGVQSGLLNVSEGLENIDINVHNLAVTGVFKSNEEVEMKKADLKGKLLEKYFDNLTVENPAAVSEMLKNGTVTSRGTVTKFTDFMPAEKLNDIKKKAAVMEKSKSIEDEKKKIETGLQMVEKLEGNFSDAYIKGALTKGTLLSSKPKDFDSLPSQVQNRYNSTVERFTGKLESKEKESQRLIKEGQKPTNNTVYSSTLVRILTEPGNKDMLPEDKISETEINDLVTSGELRADWGATLKDKLKKSQQSANPLRQARVTWATNEIKKAQANGLFGDKDSIESQTEVTSTLEAMNAWLDQNPGKNPTDFTKELLAPYSVGLVKQAINVAAVGLGAAPVYTTPTGEPTQKVVKARQEKMLQGKTSKTSPDETKAENYLKQKGLPATPANIKYVTDQMRKKK